MLLAQAAFQRRPVDAVRQDGDVLVVIARPAARDVQRLESRHLSQRHIVERRDALARGDHLGQALEMSQTDDRVRLGETPVVPEAGVRVALEAFLALVAIPARLGGDALVARDDHPALARGHHLGRIEAERRGDAEGAGPGAAQRGPVGVRRILDEPDSAARSHRSQLGHPP